jgi:hypothetical protein
MPRKKVDPHELGYRFYRGYIWRRSGAGIVRLWGPDGRFICVLGVRDIPRYVDKSIKFGWEKPAAIPRTTRFEQLALI